MVGVNDFRSRDGGGRGERVNPHWCQVVSLSKTHYYFSLSVMVNTQGVVALSWQGIAYRATREKYSP